MGGLWLGEEMTIEGKGKAKKERDGRFKMNRNFSKL
jgi:hypothetical protein